MARNIEKHNGLLNRYVAAKEGEKLSNYERRPPLNQLNNVLEIRKWIPRIQSEIDWNLRQIESNRNYTEFKIKEFKEQVEKLERIYKSFVNKALSLDPDPQWIPGELHSYISQKPTDRTREKVIYGPELVNKDIVNYDKEEEFDNITQIQESDKEVSQDIQYKEENQSNSSDIEDSDTEIPTPLIQKYSKQQIEDTSSKEPLKRSFNSNTIKYAIASQYKSKRKEK
ncbi:hypothetical protein WA158_005559 [Blastocystis sp. Blastoise]